MFDTLTLDDLYALHDKLCAEHSARHEQIMTLDDTTSPETRILDARQNETSEAADAIYAELIQRDPYLAKIEAARNA